MAENSVIGLDIVARLDQFKAEMAKIPDIGGKEAKALAAQLTRDIKAAETAAKKAADATKKAADGAKGAAKGFESFKDAADLVGMGEMAEKAGKLGGVMGALANPVGLAAAAFAAVVASVGAGVAALGAAVFASDEALASLEGFKDIGSDFYPAVPKSTLDSIAAVNASTEALGSIWDRLVVDVGANVAPAFEKVANVAVGLALTAMDTFEAFVKGKSLLHEFAVFMVEKVVDAIMGPITPLEKLAGAIVLAAQIAGVTLPSGVESALTGFSELNHSIAENTVSFYEGAAAGSDLADGFDALADRGSKFIHIQQRATAALKGGKKGADEAAAALKALNDEMARQEKLAEANRKTYDDALAKLADLEEADKRAMMSAEERATAEHADALRELEDLRNKALAVTTTTAGQETVEQEFRAASLAENDAYYAKLDELRKADKEKAKQASDDKAKEEQEALAQLYEEGAQLAADAASAIQESFADAYDVLQGNVTDLMEWQAAADEYLTESQKKALDERIKKQKQAARAAFEAQKAAAMVEAAINTALAVSQALGSASWPYNLIPAGFALAAGLAQEAAIASTQPAFHAGGPMDMAPDEMNVTARGGEWMLNPVGRRMYGDEDLRRANAGQSPGGREVIAVSVYKHTRQVDRWKSDGLAAGDPIYRAIQEGKLVGHRSDRSR